MPMQVRPVAARAIRCDDRWVVEIPSLALRVPAYDLEDLDDTVTTALSRRRRDLTWMVTVHIGSYLHIDDLPEARRRSITTAARSLPPKEEDRTA